MDGLEKLLLNKDVEIKKNTEAHKIIVSKNKVIGVETNEGIISCDAVVCNSDPTYTYKNLLGYKPNKISNNFNLKHSMSLFVLYFGWLIAYDSFKVGRTSSTILDVPSFLTEFAIPLCFGFLVIRVIVEIFIFLKDLFK